VVVLMVVGLLAIITTQKLRKVVNFTRNFFKYLLFWEKNTEVQIRLHIARYECVIKGECYILRKEWRKLV